MNGYFADFVLYPSPVAGSLASGLSGVAGSSVVIAGSGFNTTGDTQVLFGASQSPNVTCTPTWCTATAPIVGSVAEGSVPVTVRLNGESTNAGYFTYVLDGPNCTYSDTEPTPTVAGSAATFNVTCAPNTTGNPIWVYKLAGSAWQLAYGYTAASGSPPVPFMSSTVGSSGTFMSCFENSSVGLATPGESGCDLNPTTVSIQQCVPGTESVACATAGQCGGTVLNGCGGTINCQASDCSTGNCSVGHCCDVGTTWYANKCYAPGVVTCPSGYEYCGAADGCVKGKCS